jgi:hypothetical protein
MGDLAAQPRRLGPAVTQRPAMPALRHPGEKAAKKNADDHRDDEHDEQRGFDGAGCVRGKWVERNGHRVTVRYREGDADNRERQQNQHFQKAFHRQDFIDRTRGCVQLK